MNPHLFHLPPGADFPNAFAAGFLRRYGHLPPEAIARIKIIVNARRSASVIGAALEQALGPSALLPRILVVQDLADHPLGPALPPAPGELYRLLRLAELVGALIAREPTLAPREARFDLARSLIALLDELQGAGIPPAALEGIDAGPYASHWQTSLRFLQILTAHWPQMLAEAGAGPEPALRLRAAIEAICAVWAAEPPDHPVILAASTGSRPVTAALMQAVARLPSGAVVLPGFDASLPDAVRDRLGPDHPQAAMAAVLKALDVPAEAVAPWEPVPAPPQNRLIGLALHPAPVTDRWLAELPALRAEVLAATAGLTLIEADTPRAEAQAIALALREVLDHPGRTAALITPDRQLARLVTAALQRWGIRPDDSAGRPLGQTPPGIFLRLVARMAGGPVAAGRLIALLKHPLSGGEEDARREHMLQTTRLERHLRKTGRPELEAGELAAAELDAAWSAWLADCLAALAAPAETAAAHLGRLTRAAARICAGLSGDPARLWRQADGRAAADLLARFAEEAPSEQPMSGAEFVHLLELLMEAVNVPPADPANPPDPRIRILGNREARLETASRVILGGLNETVWPALPGIEPWLSRPMRAALGLAAPERQVGLAAHDFQCAAGGAEVILSRARRAEGAPTVASRWLIRLENLLGGAGEEGPAALAAMRARGEGWLTLARALDRPEAELPPAPRPSPRPPRAARPRKLSVTRIEALIRDPYAVYAEKVLKLEKLDPLGRPPDARDRGMVLHRVLQRFVEATRAGLPDDAEALLERLAGEEIDRAVPWPAERRLWRGRIRRAAAWFVKGERARRQAGQPLALEARGRMPIDLPGGPFTLTARADRIDRLDAGGLHLIDYKTGTPPGKGEVEHFNRQLHLEALIAEAGGFNGLPAEPVARVSFLGVTGSGEGGKARDFNLEPGQTANERARLTEMLALYDDPDTPYLSRLRPKTLAEEGDYDHLARRAEWEDSEEEGGA
ncbi:MAG: double-strand break repair protein AddB [Alphaproteobacteria bacterium]|nr:MAG: double-strand break repair protein AddB [Alphaproteobacteria bacterium]